MHIMCLKGLRRVNSDDEGCCDILWVLWLSLVNCIQRLYIQIIFINKMSSSSPVRNYTTQRRNSKESSFGRYPNLSQKSPEIESPNLNQENNHYQKDNQNSDMRTKLQILLKHNSQLLNQNAQLSQLVNSLRVQLDIRTRKEESQFAKINQEMGSVMVELKGQQEIHQSQLQRLLNQISKLHDQCHKLQVDKNNEMRRQQEQHEREMVQQIAQMRRSQDQSKSLMDLQINKLRENIEMKEFQYESLKTQMKSETEQLRNQNNLLQSEIEHQRKLRDLQINEITRRSKDDMRSALKHLELEKNVQIRQYENKILKIKKDLTNKDRQIQQQSKKVTGENQEVFLELSSIKKEKQYLLEQIQALTETTQQKIIRQKERISQLAVLQKENMENLFKNQKQSMVGEKEKLLSLCIQKSEQIKRLYENIQRAKEINDIERTELKNIIDGLRSRLRQVERANAEDLEHLKVKMAQLHRCDVESLQRFYENQVAALHLEINLIKEAHVADREKMYTLHHQNDELRKNFEVEISKQKAKIQDMKVKYAAAKLQFKEQITSLGTKMQLTSQSLIRETEHKDKGSKFFQAEKRKYHQIIEGKDKQIQQIHETMIRLKELNEQEIVQLKSQINMLRDSLLAKEQEFKDYKSSLQQQYERKSMKIIEENKSADPDEALEKELHEIKGKITEFQKQNFKHKKQLQFLTRENRSLQQQLGLRNGFIQSMQLQSCAAIEDEKSKVKVLMGKNEVAMKDYYESKIISRDQDNQSLRNQLRQKETDLKSIITKYHQLQKKMKQVLETQDKLSDFQNKIINLGLDQNLIKNLAQLFNRYKKADEK